MLLEGDSGTESIRTISISQSLQNKTLSFIPLFAYDYEEGLCNFNGQYCLVLKPCHMISVNFPLLPTPLLAAYGEFMCLLIVFCVEYVI